MSGPLGIVMLCHTALGRAAELARHWAASGCPVVIHVDRRVPRDDIETMRRALADCPGIGFSERYACEWGTWSLVAATLAATQQLLADHADVRHVCLVSGMCLPLRPVAELVAYLEEHSGTDFIESVTTADVGWTVGGLNIERFTLRFPFSWRTRRRLFDRYVAVQRRIGWRRRIPHGIEPHLGSQWWCLTRKTLESILNAPDRSRIERYFRRVWIPDESYFQSLARRYSTRLESRSLTLSKFDPQGRPFVFYDDHIELLRRSDCFVARKVWPGADRLFATFLAPPPWPGARLLPNPGRIDRLFSRAVERRLRGRAGLYMQSRFPRLDHENGKTSTPYSVFHGFTDLFEDFEAWLCRTTGARVHGHLFAPDRVDFAGGERFFHGALSDSALLRDHNPRAFLTNLIWNARGDRQVFQFSPRDNQACNWFMATDPNAQISVITGSWAIPLMARDADFAATRAEAARLQRIETAHLAILRSMYVKAQVRIWSLGEFLESPIEALQPILHDIAPRQRRSPTEVPRMLPLDTLGRFLQDLRNQGMQPTLVGDLPDTPSQPWPDQGRPYLVR